MWEKTKGTKDQVIKIETAAVKLFHAAFEKLCDEHNVKAVCFWARQESENFSDEEKVKLAAWFVVVGLDETSNWETRAILESYEQTEEVVKKLAFRALVKAKDWKCWCGCKSNIRV